MTLLLLVIIVGAVVVLPVLGLRRAGAGRRRQRDHHRALHTLGTVSGRSAHVGPAAATGTPRRAHVRVVPSNTPEPPASAPSMSTWRSGRSSAADPFRRPEPLDPEEVAAARGSSVPEPAFDPVNVGDLHRVVSEPTSSMRVQPVSPEPAPVAPPVPAAPASAAVGQRAATRHSPQPPRRPPRQTGGRRRALVAAGVAVVVVGGVTAVVVDRSQGGGASRSAAPRPHRATSATTLPPTSTTVAARATDTVQLVSSVAGLATYRIDGSARIQVVADGACWVEIRRGGATGEVTYTGVLAAGQSHGLARESWIRLGDPAAVHIEAGATRLDPPGSAGQPTDLQFG